MNRIFLLAVATVLLSPYLATIGVLPALAAYAPILVAMLATVAVIVSFSQDGFPPLRPVYWILGVAIFAHLAFGVIANTVQPGSVIVGGRLYLQTIPFFFLGLVAAQSREDYRLQLLVILALSSLQLPIASYQRATTVADGLMSGDSTFGTLLSSGFLSIYLIAVAGVVVTLLLRKRMRLILALPLLAVLLVPTMINETKITLVLIPLAFLIPAFTVPGANKVKTLFVSAMLTSLFLAIFIPTYDYFIKDKWGYGILDFLVMEGRIEDYLLKESEVGAKEEVGRIDSIILPLKTLKGDVVSSVLGLGMGSVTHSGLGKEFSGEYFPRYGNLVGPTVSRLLWEVGWFGVLLIYLLLALIFKDSMRLRNRNDDVGVLAQAWLPVTVIMSLTMFYLPLMESPTLGTLFWFYSGVIVTRASVPVQAERRERAPNVVVENALVRG